MIKSQIPPHRLADSPIIVASPNPKQSPNDQNSRPTSKPASEATFGDTASDAGLEVRLEHSKPKRRGMLHISDFVLRIFTGLVLIFCLSVVSFAQDSDKLVALSKQLIEAKTNADLYAPFEELKDLYFRDNKYTEFVEFLKSLSQKKKSAEPFSNYYIALTRYHQLKYLEEAKLWDEYFAEGNTYRDELTAALKNAIDNTIKFDALNISARLLLWQFHKDQQDAFAQDLLSNLMDSVLEYSGAALDPKPIKEVADKLLAYQEKGRAKELYKIYAQKLVSASTQLEELAQSALIFYKEGNLELAESIYDIYIDKQLEAGHQEKLLTSLIDIAKLFAYKDAGPNDLLYAERIFNKIEGIGGKDSLNQELMYLRAFNLEKAKEYSQAKDIYLDLVNKEPESIHRDEALFKIGIIYTYILRDLGNGKTYFEKLAPLTMLSANPESVEGLAQEGRVGPQAISSLYQLGILCQWELDTLKAKEYYNKLLEVAKGDFREIQEATKERIKEIESQSPIEYNLKTFLDVSLKEENKSFDMTKIDLRAHPYKAKKEESVSINSIVYTAASGCMQVELEYLWSGDLGNKKSSLTMPGFNTAYTDKGTKVINLIAASPSGIIDRSLDLLDVD